MRRSRLTISAFCEGQTELTPDLQDSLLGVNETLARWKIEQRRCM
jgi:hypothetical protein